MRFIPTRVHAAFDYIVGLALIVMPFWAAGNARGPAVWVPVVLGVAGNEPDDAL